jgi:hypothetical protein
MQTVELFYFQPGYAVFFDNSKYEYGMSNTGTDYPSRVPGLTQFYLYAVRVAHYIVFLCFLISSCVFKGIPRHSNL